MNLKALLGLPVLPALVDSHAIVIVITVHGQGQGSCDILGYLSSLCKQGERQIKQISSGWVVSQKRSVTLRSSSPSFIDVLMSTLFHSSTISHPRCCRSCIHACILHALKSSSGAAIAAQSADSPNCTARSDSTTAEEVRQSRVEGMSLDFTYATSKGLKGCIAT